ncbi:MAG TPA: DUF4340 domain-containing protein [Candidatus Cloacimonadota bacterium]|nr:DUF4340 domain-containing protein [Candidatus Cloacimonadota bacterium]
MNKRLLISAVILLVLLLGYYFLRLRAPEERTRRIFDLNAAKVDKIEVWNATDRVELILKDGKWIIPKPFVWDADSTRVASFFADVLAAEYPITPMSRKAGARQRYLLDDANTLHIRVSAGARSAHVLFSNLGNAWDYFCYENGSEVYQIKRKVVQHFGPDYAIWRNPLILQYFEEDLRSVRSRHTNGEFTLTRDGSQWTFSSAEDNFVVPFDNFALVKIISILQNMRTDIFADGRLPHLRKAFEKPECEVWITDIKGKTIKLSFAKVDKERFMLMVDDDPTVLYQVSYDTVYRFIRPADIFRRIMA